MDLLRQFWVICWFLVVLAWNLTSSAAHQTIHSVPSPSSFRLPPSSFRLPPSSFLLTQRKPNPEALKKYAGRYQIEVGLIPISTLDVSLENDELSIKPSLQKKRKLLHKSKTVFVDELEGKAYRFNKDDEGRIVGLTFEYEGGEYSAQRVVLPAPSLKGNTTFSLKGYPDATIVAIAGSFNNWDQSQFIFAREGDRWICRIDLQPGKHTYKFIVDGNWLLDPANPVTEEDAAGNVNSVLIKQ